MNSARKKKYIVASLVYKTNASNSTALLGDSKDPDSSIQAPSNSSYNGFKYLGIHISYKLEDLMKMNWFPILKQVIMHLLRWMPLPISWLGQIVIKMKKY